VATTRGSLERLATRDGTYPLWGEEMTQTCAKAFHEKAGRSQVDSFVFSLDKAFLLAESPLPPSFHPHSSMSDFRSVQVGRSRYSRCCHLIGDLRFVSKDEVGPGH
jgi:hypothetical protein